MTARKSTPVANHSSPPTPLSELVRRGELHAVDCPSRDVLKHVSSLWGVLCLIALRDGALRYSELRRKATGVSEKMLTQTLKRLEEDGFLIRRSYPIVPPHVEYRLTELGMEIADRMADVADWIELNLGQIMQARRSSMVRLEVARPG